MERAPKGATSRSARSAPRRLINSPRAAQLSQGRAAMRARTSNPRRRLDRLPSIVPPELLPSKFSYRRCGICEWEGQLAYGAGIEPDCPVCHAPTVLVAVLQPMSQSDSLQKNPHAAALGRLGGQRGGPARAALLSPKRRRDIARKAALVRWRGKDTDK
jgi:hypothetical protein